MTALRQSIIAELERVPEDKLYVIMKFIDTLTEETGKKRRVMIWSNLLCRLQKEDRMQMLM